MGKPKTRQELQPQTSILAPQLQPHSKVKHPIISFQVHLLSNILNLSSSLSAPQDIEYDNFPLMLLRILTKEGFDCRAISFPASSYFPCLNFNPVPAFYLWASMFLSQLPLFSWSLSIYLSQFSSNMNFWQGVHIVLPVLLHLTSIFLPIVPGYGVHMLVFSQYMSLVASLLHLLSICPR